MNNRQLVAQGVEWVKANRQELIASYIEALAGLPTDYYRKMGQANLTQMVTANLDALIQRLEGAPFEHERMKAMMVGIMRHGVKFEDLLAGTDQMFDSFVRQAQETLQPAQPQVYEALLHKVEYALNLLKSTMAAAQIELTS